IINCGEVYGRTQMVDVHRENFSTKKGSPPSTTLPLDNTKYPNVWITTKMDSDGKKLIIGTKSWNLLVTSSLRIDTIKPPSVSGTHVHFDLDHDQAKTTAIFLNIASIKKASLLA
ncbi:hypothetical protein BDB00DRAFT_745459, partial [Zychaea mexicana]|uniref:uncharacterized protein n=1 Tax=Zychaea mexicana TaxID=64656 RepID=UPI0022FEFD7F